jgi:peptide/nickel transport system ATP-binding protein
MREIARIGEAADPRRERQPDDQALLEVKGLEVSLGDGVKLLDGVDLRIARGEVVGMVGESGAGKSLTALSVIRMLPHAARITGGRILFDGRDLASAGKATLRQLRGGQVGVVFQDPLSALNPLMTVGAQIEEALRLHGTARRQARSRAVELLALVGIHDPADAVHDYPHEFSGGMRQRVMFAIAVANNPRLLIADEPTTGLDVTIQAAVLRLILKLREELGTAVLLITHDIGVVEEVCDRVTVLYGGRVMEVGSGKQVLGTPRHPYTVELIRSVPRIDAEPVNQLAVIPGAPPLPGELASGCPFAPRCAFAMERCDTNVPQLAVGADGSGIACWLTGDHPELRSRPIEPDVAQTPPRTAVSRAAVSCAGGGDGDPAGEAIVEISDLRICYGSAGRRGRATTPAAVDGVTLTASTGRVLGLIGESGSGKTSVAKAIVGLVKPTSGIVRVNGLSWTEATAAETAAMRHTVQLVFQDSLAAMDPRWRVRQIVSEPVRDGRYGFGLELVSLLEAVGLDRRFLDRYPDELSGGQRQRVGLARALAIGPRLIVADEPVSALDVSVQAQVINLLAELRDMFGVGLLLVTHDLAVARHLADEVAVMHHGRIVEQGPAARVFQEPREAYTAELIGSVPGRRMCPGKQLDNGQSAGQPPTAPAGIPGSTEVPG